MNKVRELIRQGKKGVIAPCAYDAISAKAIEEAGFEVLGTSGYSIHGALLGQPDKGIISFKEMLDTCSNIVDAVSIPVLADADGGYGNALNVYNTVKAFEKAGLAGLFIEDQVFPPNCPLLKKTELVSKMEMVGKIEAAVAARSDPEFMIVARTDAPFEEAIDRAKAYVQAGADMIKFVPHKRQEVLDYAKALEIPLHIGVDGTDTFAGLTAKDLGDLGYDIVTYPFVCLFSYVKAIRDSLSILKEKGSIESIQSMVSFSDYRKFIGDEGFSELEARFVRK